MVLGIVVFCRCAMPPTSEPAAESTQPLPDTLTTLFEPSQRCPTFSSMEGLLDPRVSGTEYDLLRRSFFDTCVEPTLSKKAALSAAWDYFKSRTDRRAHGNLKGTGISADGASHLLNWFSQRDCFTVGSSKDDVLRVQGTPDEIGASMLRYGASTVYFEKDRVARWDVLPGSPLKVTLLPSNTSNTSLTSSRFSVGSTKDEVLLAQGPPNQYGEYRWKYGDSTVFFAKGCVVRWAESSNNPLNAK